MVTTNTGLTVTHAEGVVSVSGELDSVSASDLALVLNQRAGSLVLDLSGVEFMDSAGVRVLVDAYLRLQRTDDRLSIVAASRPVRRVLDICGLFAMLADAPEADAAVSSVA